MMESGESNCGDIKRFLDLTIIFLAIRYFKSRLISMSDSFMCPTLASSLFFKYCVMRTMLCSAMDNLYIYFQYIYILNNN